MTKVKDDNFFSDENETSGAPVWFKRENIGDSVKGTILKTFIKPADGTYNEQLVYELQTEDGEFINLPVFTPYMKKALSRAKVGQIIGAKYTGDFLSDEMKKKGKNAAKTVKVYLGEMDPNYGSFTGMEEVKDEINVDEVEL